MLEIPAAEQWRRMPLWRFAQEVKERADGRDIPVLSVTKHAGLVPSGEYFNRTVHSRDTSNYKVLARGDFAYATIHLDEGSIDYLRGEVADQGAVSPMYTVFRVDPEIADREFMKFLLRSDHALRVWQRIGKGSITRRKSIPFKILGKVEIPVPPLIEQRKIAAILSIVDHTIATTRNVIEQLKRVQQGLLKTLMTGGIGHTRFKKTEIGEIPEAWELAYVRDVLVDGPRNGIYKTADELGSGSLIVGQTAITSERRLDFSQARRAKLSRQEIATWGLTYGDVLLTRVYATPEGCGRPAFVNAPPEPAVFESNMMRIRPNPKAVLGLFLFYWLQVPRVRAHLMERSSSSNQTSINQKMVERLPVPRPAVEEQQEICERLEGLESLRDVGMIIQERLVALKRGLMQDLLTGRVRVQPD